ncbi:MAG: adenylate kinase family protein [archaeon]
MKKFLIVITGSVGTGKTSVAEALAALLKPGHEHIDISRLVRKNRRKLSSGYDRERKSVIVDLEKTKKFLRKEGFLRKGNILESHYSHLVVAEKPDFVFVLRCEPKVLDRRLIGRKYPEKKRAENILAEILDAASIETEQRFGRGATIEIDTTGKTPAAVAGKIFSIVSGKKNALAGGRKRDFAEKYLGKGFGKSGLSFRLPP